MVACGFAGNHVSARLAFDDGLGVLLAVLCRSGVALGFMLGVVLWRGQRIRLPQGTRGWQIAVGLLIALQSLGLYTGVARIPVALALLIHNTFPIMLVLLTWALGGPRPTPRTVLIMAFILSGLVLALDVPEKLALPDGVPFSWWLGVFAVFVAAAAFTCALWITDHKLQALSGSVRSMYTLAIVFVSMAAAGSLDLIPGGMSLPQTSTGWSGLAGLIVLYGFAFSLLFITVPRLDMPRNSPVMNFEPVASLILGWLLLGQLLSPAQMLGGAVVITGIVILSLQRQG